MLWISFCLKVFYIEYDSLTFLYSIYTIITIIFYLCSLKSKGEKKPSTYCVEVKDIYFGTGHKEMKTIPCRNMLPSTMELEEEREKFQEFLKS